MSSEIDDITKGIAERVGTNSGLGSTLKFTFEGQGTIYIDGKSAPNSVTNDDKAADCTITVSLENFKKMMAGELDGTTAFMTGKLKVAGDMSVAMKIGPLLSRK